MPHVGRNQYTRAKEQAAQLAVDPDYNDEKPHINTSKNAIYNFTEWKVKNYKTLKEEVLVPSALPKLIKEWIEFTVKPSTAHATEYFSDRGIPWGYIVEIMKKSPELAEVYTLVKEIIKNKREGRLLEDFTWLRNTQAMYDPEVNDFEERRINMRNKLNAMEYSIEEIKAYLLEIGHGKIEETQEVNELRENHAKLIECRDEGTTK